MNSQRAKKQTPGIAMIGTVRERTVCLYLQLRFFVRCNLLLLALLAVFCVGIWALPGLCHLLRVEW